MSVPRIRHGVSGDGYYAKSEDGLWVRSLWDRECGVVRLSWQPRYRIRDGQAVLLDENGEVMRADPIALAGYSETAWVDAASVCKIDRKSFLAFGGDDVVGLIAAIMRHSCLLLACGYGLGADQVSGWFVSPEDGEMIMANTDYRIISDGVGGFSKLGGMVLHVERYEEDQLFGVVRVSEGDASFRFEHVSGGGFVADWLRSTILVC